MATYNGAKFLKEQLGSLVAQTRLPDELIICDDTSSDQSMDILLDFARTAPFKVEVIRNEKNVGYAKNFEKAISLCTGEIIFLSDQDDVWFPEKIEIVEAELLKDPSTWVVVHDAEIADGNLRRTGLTVAGQIESVWGSSDMLLLGCCMAFRSAMKSLIFPVPSNIHGHDGWINALGIALECRKFIKDILQVYRRHSTNTSECVSTRTKRVSRWGLFKEQLRWTNFKNNTVAASERRILKLQVLQQRLVENETYLRKMFGSNARFEHAITKIERDLVMNFSRLEFQKQAFIRRVIGATDFYLRGNYREFEGWKSYAKDCLK
jgi:glycosyltransferase involved in cell wall biosynthesis